MFPFEGSDKLPSANAVGQYCIYERLALQDITGLLNYIALSLLLFQTKIEYTASYSK